MQKKLVDELYSRMKSNNYMFYTLKRAYGKTYYDAPISAKEAFLELVSGLEEVTPINYDNVFFISTALAIQDKRYCDATVPSYLKEVFNDEHVSESQKMRIRRLLCTDAEDNTDSLLHQLTKIMQKPLKEKGFNLNYLYDDLKNWDNARLNWAKYIVKN